MTQSSLLIFLRFHACYYVCLGIKILDHDYSLVSVDHTTASDHHLIELLISSLILILYKSLEDILIGLTKESPSLAVACEAIHLKVLFSLPIGGRHDYFRTLAHICLHDIDRA